MNIWQALLCIVVGVAFIAGLAVLVKAIRGSLAVEEREDDCVTEYDYSWRPRNPPKSEGKR